MAQAIYTRHAIYTRPAFLALKQWRHQLHRHRLHQPSKARKTHCGTTGEGESGCKEDERGSENGNERGSGKHSRRPFGFRGTLNGPADLTMNKLRGVDGVTPTKRASVRCWRCRVRHDDRMTRLNQPTIAVCSNALVAAYILWLWGYSIHAHRQVFFLRRCRVYGISERSISARSYKHEDMLIYSVVFLHAVYSYLQHRIDMCGNATWSLMKLQP